MTALKQLVVWYGAREGITIGKVCELTGDEKWAAFVDDAGKSRTFALRDCVGVRGSWETPTSENTENTENTKQSPPAQAASNSAVNILNEAVNCIGDRASERDKESERSMAAAVRAFNGLYGKELTEEQGWMFMALLKMSRAEGGGFRQDDYVDGAAYFALAGECRGRQ